MGLLKKLFNQHAAPFREAHVRRFLEAELQRLGIPHFVDPVGNLVLGADSAKAYRSKVTKKSTEPVRFFIAHMDHPGFHGVRWVDKRRLAVKWYGGSPTKDLEGARVWLADLHTVFGSAVLRRAKLTKSGRSIDTAEVVLGPQLAKLPLPDAKSLYGGLSFRAPLWSAGTRLYTKVADDLCGVYCIVSLAKQLYRSGKGHPNFLGILTRAEEVGFIGTIGHLELGWLKGARRPLINVNLEASRTLPGAEIGKGPIVRLGDRLTVFDPGGIRVLTELAQKTLKGRYQRRIMDGGACEASAVTAYGMRAIGISVPLGNYHNQNFEGGPDARAALGPAPEFVDKRDLQGMLKLCGALMQSGLPWETAWKQTALSFKKSLSTYRVQMRGGFSLDSE
ncbi:MAG: hypothetical protein H6617_06720 [Bdellovibrionaceae bacterium]|nr:hypothetical protein [Pseudobdellovibrionaceae bacterium]